MDLKDRFIENWKNFFVQLKSCKNTFEGTTENLHQFLLDYTRLYKVYFRLFKLVEDGSKVTENIEVLIIISSSLDCWFYWNSRKQEACLIMIKSCRLNKIKLRLMICKSYKISDPKSTVNICNRYTRFHEIQHRTLYWIIVLTQSHGFKSYRQ